MNTRPFYQLFSILTALTVAATGCRTAKRQAPPGKDVGAGAGLPHKMVEVDHDGNRYTNQPSRVEPVDAHSLLVIEFPKTSEVAPAPLSQDWQDLQSVLHYLNQRNDEWKKLNERKVDEQDEAAVKQLHDDTRAAAKNAVSLLNDLNGLGLRGARLSAVLGGRALGLTNRQRFPYLNLALWATNNWNELRAQAESYRKLVESNSKVSVTVQAIRESLSGGRSLLHIDDWDTRPEGAFSPIDRTGLRPTEAEQKRLDMERAAAESVAQLINSARTNQDGFKAAFQAKLAELKAKSGTLQTEFEELAKNWKIALLPAVLTNLDGLAASDKPEVRAAAVNLKTNVQALADVFRTITNDIATADQLVTLLANPRSINPLDLLLGTNSLVSTAEKLLSDAGTIATVLEHLPERLANIETNLPALGTEAMDRIKSLIDTEFKTALSEFREKFPAESKALAAVWEVVTSSLVPAAAGEALAQADSQLIPHSLDNLVPATLDLKKSGLALGDIVTMRLRATNTVSGQLVESDTYQNEIGLMGLHGKPAVHLIFARALSGPSQATDWKANVAAAVEWHYTIRRPKNGWGKTWNWLYPGAGIHLASLDQGDDSFEVGVGGCVSLWDGLLTSGFGYNLSVKREYVWVGVNLLSVLNTAKNQFITK